MDEEHREGDEIAGLELGGEPAAVEFIAEDGRVVGEGAAEGPAEAFGAGRGIFDLLGFVGAVGVDVAVDVVFEEVHAFVRTFEDHEATEFE